MVVVYSFIGISDGLRTNSHSLLSNQVYEIVVLLKKSKIFQTWLTDELKSCNEASI